MNRRRHRRRAAPAIRAIALVFAAAALAACAHTGPVLDPDPAATARARTLIAQLAGPDAAGRLPGSPGFDHAADIVRAELARLPDTRVTTHPFTIDQPTAGPIRTFNTLALLPARPADTPADGFVLLIAHLDHLGRRELHPLPAEHAGELHPGADDNATGVAALLETARLLADAPARPATALLITSGEELGLAGARAFVTNPPAPLRDLGGADACALAINLDMLGSARDARRYELRTAPEQTGDLARRDDLARRLARTIERTTGRPVRTAPTGPNSSDHAPLAAAGVTALLLTTGRHERAHTPLDTPERTDPAGVAAAAAALARFLIRPTGSAPRAAEVARESEEVTDVDRARPVEVDR